LKAGNARFISKVYSNSPTQRSCYVETGISQGKVRDRQVGRRHCAPISLVLTQPSETRPKRRNRKTALAKHERDRFIDISAKELDAENLLIARSHNANILL